jgi:hypothetical protein
MVYVDHDLSGWNHSSATTTAGAFQGTVSFKNGDSLSRRDLFQVATVKNIIADFFSSSAFLEMFPNGRSTIQLLCNVCDTLQS